MKKILTNLGVIILSLIITFGLANVFCLYHFGDDFTITTTIYLLYGFIFLNYILFSLIYIIRKKLKNEKIGIKKIFRMLLIFMALIFLLGFIITLNLDWLTYYSNYNSSPFYVFILVRALEFLLPAIILIIIDTILVIKNKKWNYISMKKTKIFAYTKK